MSGRQCTDMHFDEISSSDNTFFKFQLIPLRLLLVRLFLEHSFKILSSFIIVIIFNNTPDEMKKRQLMYYLIWSQFWKNWGLHNLFEFWIDFFWTIAKKQCRKNERVLDYVWTIKYFVKIQRTIKFENASMCRLCSGHVCT